MLAFMVDGCATATHACFDGRLLFSRDACFVVEDCSTSLHACFDG